MSWSCENSQPHPLETCSCHRAVLGILGLSCRPAKASLRGDERREPVEKGPSHASHLVPALQPPMPSNHRCKAEASVSSLRPKPKEPPNRAQPKWWLRKPWAKYTVVLLTYFRVVCYCSKANNKLLKCPHFRKYFPNCNTTSCVCICLSILSDFLHGQSCPNAVHTHCE